MSLFEENKVIFGERKVQNLLGFSGIEHDECFATLVSNHERRIHQSSIKNQLSSLSSPLCANYIFHGNELYDIVLRIKKDEESRIP
jgi:hypothetical protein